MREFYSYGPVNCRRHFCGPRRELVRSCLQHIVGDLEDGGHYFTIWSPRQGGKMSPLCGLCARGSGATPKAPEHSAAVRP